MWRQHEKTDMHRLWPHVRHLALRQAAQLCTMVTWKSRAIYRRECCRPHNQTYGDFDSFLLNAGRDLTQPSRP